MTKKNIFKRPSESRGNQLSGPHCVAGAHPPPMDYTCSSASCTAPRRRKGNCTEKMLWKGVGQEERRVWPLHRSWISRAGLCCFEFTIQLLLLMLGPAMVRMTQKSGKWPWWFHYWIRGSIIALWGRCGCRGVFIDNLDRIWMLVLWDTRAC